MRACIQRVKHAHVTVDGHVVGRIGPGVLVLLGVCHSDGPDECLWLAQKIATLRIFPNEAGKMSLSIKDLGYQALVVSQFTLYGNARNGRRPDFTEAAPPTVADPLYHKFVALLEHELGSKVPTGQFGAMMDVHLLNDGPVTLIIDTL
jgi:D-aminoacyl-tRNA deacylase